MDGEARAADLARPRADRGAPAQQAPTPDGEPGAPARRAPFGDNPVVGARGLRTQQRVLEAALQSFSELGYDRTAYQDVPTPFGLFPNVDPATVAVELQQGTVQGVYDALADVGLPPAVPPFP